MPRPKSIRIEDDVVPIEWDVKLGRLAEGYMRAADWAPGQIRMGRGSYGRAEKFELFHELGHEIWKRACLSDYLSTKTEELVLDSLTSWLLMVLRQNPELTEWLMEGE